MIVSFDYDRTISLEEVFDYAQRLTKSHRVVITTQRPPLLHREVFKTAKRLGIGLNDIIFCGTRDKAEVLRDIDYAFHLDDKPIDAPRCVILSDDFELHCNRLLDEHERAVKGLSRVR